MVAILAHDGLDRHETTDARRQANVAMENPPVI